MDGTSTNDYSGDTVINAAGIGNSGSHNVTIWVDNSSHNNVMPSGSGKGNLVLNGGAGNLAQFDIGGSTQTINGLSSTGTVANTLVTSNPGGGTLIVGAHNGDSTFGGVIGTSGGNGTASLNFTKVGTGTQTLTGNNNYTGITSINAGNLNLASANALGGGGSISFGGGTLQYTPGNQVDYASRIVNSASPISIDTNSESVIYTGSIDSSNFGGLTKVGNGILTLSGANTYSGPTTINGGTLSVNGSIFSGSTSTINSGGILSGNGTVGDVVASGGNLAPGNSVGTSMPAISL